ncbi:hypothetical protein [Marinigracilibium pacificum]|uniref:Uncharacterized protein n=1 Tax=Marinigracilibium pacificum TaxID=2729599 RepID=A0A848IVE8_9BACT|nr:hypothetical protein [Marinigracilibium pacificum]NMM48453.1 hypothetical protein [Marinigracilibium pacificum]
MIKKALSIMLMSAMLGGCTTEAFVGEQTTPYFDKFFGNANDDHSYHVSQLEDGGYLITGSSENLQRGDNDILVIKCDAKGNRQWSETFGGTLNDIGSDAIVGSDGRLYVTGMITDPTTEDRNVALLALDVNSGSLIDSLSFGLSNRMEMGLKIFNSNAGTLMVMANRDDEKGSEMVLTEFNLVAQDTIYRDYGFVSNRDSVTTILQSANENLVWCGTVKYSETQSNIRVTSTNLSGQVVWDFVLPTTVVQSAADMDHAGQGFIVAGTEGPETNANMVLVNITPDGTKSWQALIQEPGNQKASGVSQTVDGGYIVVGTTNYLSDDEQIFLVKTDPSGNVQWKKYFGGSSNDRGIDVIESNDGNYVVLGTSTISNNSILELIKTNNKGLMVD